MNATEEDEAADVALERSYWDVPVRLTGRTFQQFSAKLAAQLQSLETRWIRKPLPGEPHCRQFKASEIS